MHHLVSRVLGTPIACLWAAVLAVAGCAGEPSAPVPEVGVQHAPEGVSAVLGRAPASIGGFASVVVLEPREAGDFPTPARAPGIGQYGTQFTPTVLLVRRGQEVEFSNDEEVVHNVHAIHDESGDTAFNVTTFVGTPYVHAFEETGVYKLSCGIHPAMLAFLLVTDSPYGVVAADSGDFRIESVPPGAYDLVVWNADVLEPKVSAVEVTEGELDLGAVGQG